MKNFALVMIAVSAIAFFPLLTIWSISTLWDVPAVYDFWHWLAALLIGGALFGSGKSSS